MMDSISHTEIMEQLPAYALGILTDEEVAQVEAHLSQCGLCQQEVAAYEEVVGLLPLSQPLESPPDVLRQRLLDEVRIEKTAVSPPLIPTVWQQLKTAVSSLQHSPALLLGTLLLLLLFAFIWQQTQTTPAPTQFALTSTDEAPNSRGLIEVTDAPEQALLFVEGLPTLDSDLQYQLWLIKDGNRISGAIFSVDERGEAAVSISAPIPLEEYDAFGITIEPAGGSPGPTGKRVLGYNL